MPGLGLFMCMVNLKNQCVTFVYFNYLFNAIFGVPIWSNKMLILMEPYKQLHTFSLNFSFESFFFINRLQVSLTLMQTIFLMYISCLQAIYFVFLGPANNFFKYFSYPPPPPSPLSRKIMVRPLCDTS